MASSSLSSKGKYSKRRRAQRELLFINDDTGRKPIHPHALRYALKVVEQEAQRSTKSVAQTYAENGDVEMSRIVQVQASQHTRKIVERVRAVLRRTKIPARYHRIEDVNLGALELRNRKRREEMEELRDELDRLETQCHDYGQREYRSAKSECVTSSTTTGGVAPDLGDGRVQMDPNMNDNNNDIHPLLRKFMVDPTKQMEQKEKPNVTVKRTTDPSKVFSVLLDKLPSVYDNHG